MKRIVKQPDGKYAIWSTIVDDFVMTDASREDVIKEYIGNAVMDTVRSTTTQIERADNEALSAFEDLINSRHQEDIAP